VKITNLKCLTPDEKFIKLWKVRTEENNSWVFASRKEKPEAVYHSGKPDAVVIVPFIGNDILLTKEYRIPIGDWELGFPAGLIDKGESIEEAAKRELLEETGLEVKNIILISPILYTSAGLTDESFSYVFVEATGNISNKNQEKTERIESIIVSRNNIKDTISNSNMKLSSKLWPIVSMIELFSIEGNFVNV
jgi:ADP-ribose pyrophosphatase